MPVKITPPGGYACMYADSFRVSEPIRCGTYQGNSVTKGGRKRVDDFHGGIQPPCQSIIATPRLVERRDLIPQ
jgi:hypothetical protein